MAPGIRRPTWNTAEHTGVLMAVPEQWCRKYRGKSCSASSFNNFLTVLIQTEYVTFSWTENVALSRHWVSGARVNSALTLLPIRQEDKCSPKLWHTCKKLGHQHAPTNCFPKGLFCVVLRDLALEGCQAIHFWFTNNLNTSPQCFLPLPCKHYSLEML